MLYIGTSLEGCLRSIMAGEVSVDDVFVIVTRTSAPDYDGFTKVVTHYHSKQPLTANKIHLKDFDLEKVLELAHYLWHNGKIHQPRNFIGGEASFYYNHPGILGEQLWLHIAPLNTNTSPIVVDAWEKYKVLDNLTKDG